MSNSSLRSDYQIYEIETSAPNMIFPYGGYYFGPIGAPAASLARGATAAVMQPSVETHVLTKPLQIVKKFTSPRFPKPSRAALSQLPTTIGDIVVTNLPSTSSLNYGPIYSGNDPMTHLAEVPFSGKGAAYAAAYSDADVPRLVFPQGTQVGTASLSLGGVVSLADHFALGAAYVDSAMFQVTSGTTHGANDTLRSISELSNIPGASNSPVTAGYVVNNTPGSPDYWAAHIRTRATVNIDPPHEHCCVQRMCFTIKKGTVWPGDYSILCNETERYITNPTLRHDSCCSLLENQANIFLEDWCFDTDKYTLGETVQLYRYDNQNLPVVCIHPGTCLSLCFSVVTSLETDSISTSVPDAVALASLMADLNGGSLFLYLPSGTGPGVMVTKEFDLPEGNLPLLTQVFDTDGSFPGTPSALYPGDATGTDRDLTLFGNQTVIPQGTSIPSCFTIDVGMDFPSGFEIAESTTILAPSNSVNNNYTPSGTLIGTQQQFVLTAQSRLWFNYVVMAKGFTFSGSYVFEDIICEAKKIKVPCGSTTVGPLSLPYSSSWDEFYLESAYLSAGHKLISSLTFNKGQVVPSPISLVVGSVLAKGSVLAPGTNTGADISATTDMRFMAGITINSPFNICNTITTTTLTNFIAGTIFRKNTTIPALTVITNGNTAPAPIVIGVGANVVLQAGSELINPVLQPGFTFGPGTGFESCAEIPANSTISAGAVLPALTTFLIGSKFPFPFPLPQGVVFDCQHTIFAGTVFTEGNRIPRIFGKNQQDLSGSGNGANANKPFLFVTLNGKTYMVLKSGTSLLSKFHIPKGSVLLPSMDLTSVYITPGTPPTTTFDASVWNGTAWVTTPIGTPPFNITLTDSEYTVASGGCVGTGSGYFELVQGVPTANSIWLLVDVISPLDLAIPVSDSFSVFDRIVFNVPFVIQNDTKPDQSYLVQSDGAVLFPANKELPLNVILNSDFTIPVTFSLSRKITLPHIQDCYITSILEDPNSWIRFPSTVQQTRTRFLIGSGGLTIAPGLGNSNAGLTLTTGNVIDVNNGGITILSPITLGEDWRLLFALNNVPFPFTMTGVFLPAGSSLPADICLLKDSPLPAGLTSANPIQLAKDYIVCAEASPFVLTADSFIAECSTFAAGSLFASGIEAHGVTYGEVCFWPDEDELVLAPGTSVPESLRYSYFGDSSVMIFSQNHKDESLENTVASLQAQVAALTAFIKMKYGAGVNV